MPIITHWEKLLDSDWPRHCEFIHNLRANSVSRGNLQISRAKSVIHSECKYKNIEILRMTGEVTERFNEITLF